MQPFRFVILGAGRIAHKFADAAARTQGAVIAAVASKSIDRACAFAEQEGIPAFYGDYEQMLLEEKPDAAYIATTVNFHYEQILLCIRHGVAVLCEKAMFANSREADAAYAYAREKNVFLMEGMWSRFLPHMRRARAWIEEGALGTLLAIDANLGYCPDYAPDNRFFNKALGGGTGRDILVYCYELTQMLAGEMPQAVQSLHLNCETGVDVINYVNLRFSSFLASLRCYFTAYGQQDLFKVYGTDGFIEIPLPHMGRACTLFRRDGTQERFDCPVENGFVFELKEVIDCVRTGKLESAVVPWSLTRSCAALFDDLT
jgi:predicted dehydrogenase